MRRLSDRDAMTEARRFKTLTLSSATSGDVALPQPTAQNQMIIANATPVWALLTAPTAEFHVPIAGADPFTPVWAAMTVAAISDLAYATPALTLSTSNAEGSADTVIRSNATILVFDATVPGIIQPDDAAATGSASVAAQRDHTHGIVCAAPASPSVNLATSAEGLGTAFARAAHAHQLDQSISPTWTGSHTFVGYVLSQAEDACGFLSYRYSDDGTGPYWSGRRARGTIVSPTIVSDNDNLWEMVMMGHDGTDWIPAAGIRVVVDGTPGTDDMPAEIVFRTTPAGSDTPEARVRIRSTGVTELYNGLAFGGATGVNVVTVPNNAAQAMHIVDAGGIEYLSIVSTDAQPAVVFNQGATDVDFRVEASGEANALFVRGSDHYIGANVENPLAPFHIHGRVLLNTGLAFSGTVPAPYIEIPDNLEDPSGAIRVVDAGGIEYLRIVSLNTQPAILFNPAGVDIDLRMAASGEANALFVQGSDGKIGIWTTTLNARVEIGGAAGPAILNLPTNLATIDAGLSTRDTADESVVIFGTNVHTNYTGRIVVAKAGACIRCDTRDQAGGTTGGNKYTVFQVLTRAAGAAQGAYTVPFQIAAGAPSGSFVIGRTGDVKILEDGLLVRLTGTKEFAWIINDPAVGTYGQVYIGWACTVTQVRANTESGTSCTFNIEERGTLGSAGTDILSSDMVADADGEDVTSSFNNASLALGNHLTIAISAVSGVVDCVNIALIVTPD